MWLRCALHAHTTALRRRARARCARAHYARAGYDVLAITDHWRGPRRLRRRAARDAERGAELHPPGGARRPRARRSGSPRSRPRALGAEYADLQATADWIARARRRRLPRAPVLDGCDSRRSSSLTTSPGSRSTTQAASSRSGGACPPSTGTSCSRPARRCFGLATDDSHYPGFDSDLAWTWLRVPERSAEAVLAGARRGLLLR